MHTHQNGLHIIYGAAVYFPCIWLYRSGCDHKIFVRSNQQSPVWMLPKQTLINEVPSSHEIVHFFQAHDPNRQGEILCW